MRSGILIILVLTSSPGMAAGFKAVWGDCVAGQPPAVSIPACTALIARTKDLHIREHAFNTRGLALLGQSQYGPAIDDFSQVIRFDPHVAGYFDNRQNAYKAAGRLTEALADADAAVRLAPTYAFVFHARANLLAAMGQFGRARLDFDRAASLAPDDAGLYVDRGRTLLRSGDPDAAVADFTHAIALNRASATAYRERGLIYQSAGLNDRALEDLRAARILAPDDTAVFEALKILDAKSMAAPPS